MKNIHSPEDFGQNDCFRKEMPDGTTTIRRFSVSVISVPQDYLIQIV